MIYHSAWSLVWFTLYPSKRNWNKNSAFPFLVFPAIFCHPSEGKACHEVTVGLHSVTDGRIKPCCVGRWYMEAQVELNVSFLSLYLIQRGLWIFLSCRRDQGAKGENSFSLRTNLCSGLEIPRTCCDSVGSVARTTVLGKLLTAWHLRAYKMLDNILNYAN